MLVLFVSILASLLCSDCGTGQPPVYQCVCRDGNSVVMVYQNAPCTQTANCVAMPNKAAPSGAGEGGAAGGGGEGAGGEP